MSHTHHNETFPRGALWAAAVLVSGTLLATAIAHGTRQGLSEMPASVAVEVRDLRFEDRPEGTIVIYRAGESRLAEVLPAGGNGFLRGVLRGLARERLRQHGEVAAPFRLTRWADGRLTIADPSTGRSTDVAAFGPDNFQAFARVFVATAPHAARDDRLADSAIGARPGPSNPGATP